MSTHPLIRLANVYEILHEASGKKEMNYGNIDYRCGRSLGLHDNELISTGAARAAFEGQLLLESFVLEQPAASQDMDVEHLLTVMWDATQLLRQIENRKALSAVNIGDAKLLRMAASLMTMGTTLNPSESLQNFDWLHAILDEVLTDLDDSSISAQMKLAIRRQVLQSKQVLDHDPVSPDLVIRYLATLSGLLSAAAQAEPKASKARQFMKWSVRIAGGILIDALTGVPAASITNALLLAIDSSASDESDDDLVDLGEAADA